MKLSKQVIRLVEGVDYLKPEYEKDGNSENYAQQLEFLKYAYDEFNREFFNNELPVPKIEFKKAVSVDRLKSIGLWYPTVKTLKIDQRLFYVGWEFFKEVLAHEMTHQWMSEFVSEKEGHGANWKSKLSSIGFQARTKIPIPAGSYRSPSEIVKLKSLKDMMDSTPKVTNPEVGQPVKMLSKEGWVLGLFAGKMISIGAVRTSKGYVQAPMTSIYEPNKDELKEIKKMNIVIDKDFK